MSSEPRKYVALAPELLLAFAELPPPVDWASLYNTLLREMELALLDVYRGGIDIQNLAYNLPEPCVWSFRGPGGEAKIQIRYPMVVLQIPGHTLRSPVFDGGLRAAAQLAVEFAQGDHDVR